MSLFDVKTAPLNIGGPIPVVVWKDALTPDEVDAIIAYGDQLQPMKDRKSVV